MTIMLAPLPSAMPAPKKDAPKPVSKPAPAPAAPPRHAAHAHAAAHVAHATRPKPQRQPQPTTPTPTPDATPTPPTTPTAAPTEPAPTPPSSAAVAPAPAPSRPDASFAASLRAAIQAALRYPESARMQGTTGRTLVAFVYRDSAVSDIRVVASSGMGLLDHAAVAAVRDAQCPPPPHGMEGKSLAEQLWVDFTLGGNG
jgi:protein TonB